MRTHSSVLPRSNIVIKSCLGAVSQTPKGDLKLYSVYVPTNHV